MQRAAVEGQNDHLVACALVGDFTFVVPTSEVLAAVKTVRLALEKLLDKEEPAKAHRLFINTACPGNTYPLWIGQC